jgi:hypothetical protein
VSAIALTLCVAGVDAGTSLGIGGAVAFSLLALSIASRLRRSGLIVTETGLRDFRARRDQEVPWSHVERAQIRDDGSLVIDVDVSELSVSLSATHALVLPAILRELRHA